MNFEALASMVGGEIAERGEVSRTRFVIVRNSRRAILFLQREWNGKTAYIIGPTKAEEERARTDPFGMFSDVPTSTRSGRLI